MVREFAGRKFNGTVTRTSQALDPATRTLLTEVQVPNPQSDAVAGNVRAGAVLRQSAKSAAIGPRRCRDGDYRWSPGGSLTGSHSRGAEPTGAAASATEEGVGKKGEELQKKREQEVAQAKKIALRTVQVGATMGPKQRFPRDCSRRGGCGEPRRRYAQRRHCPSQTGAGGTGPGPAPESDGNAGAGRRDWIVKHGCADDGIAAKAAGAARWQGHRQRRQRQGQDKGEKK